MNEHAANTQHRGAPTTWQRRTASFQEAIKSGWRSYRLVPWLFKQAGRTEAVASTLQAFGGAQLFATFDFSLERGYGIDNLATEWGASIAHSETVAFIAKLGNREIDADTGALPHRLYDALGRVGGSIRDLAILAPSRGRLVHELQLARAGELTWLPGAGARSLLRGTFEGVPLFAAQPAEAANLWIVDFTRVGWWQHVGAFDELTTRADLLRDRLVAVNGTRDLATQITAEEFFAIALDDHRAARGLRIATDGA